MPKSNSSTVWGERSRAITWASRSKRRTASSDTPARPSPASEGRISLMAAGRASMRCRARQTSPIPPSPSFSSRLVAPQLARALDLGAQVVDHAGADIGHADHEEIGEHEPEEELRRVHPERGGAGGDHEPDDDGDRADRGQRRQQRPARARSARRP